MFFLPTLYIYILYNIRTHIIDVTTVAGKL